jgi:hypothetical protein
MAHITEQTTKMGKIPSVSLPTKESCNRYVRKGLDVTLEYPECYYTGCYARKIEALRPRYRALLNQNYEEWFYYPERYKHSIEGYLLYKNVEYFRWHVAGDIPWYNEDRYYKMMCDIAVKFDQVRFLCFTKKYNEAHEKHPRNLKMIWSQWPDMDMPPVPPTVGIAYLLGKEEKPERGSECNGKCDVCLSCFDSEERKVVYFKRH